MTPSVPAVIRVKMAMTELPSMDWYSGALARAPTMAAAPRVMNTGEMAVAVVPHLSAMALKVRVLSVDSSGGACL
jgi:hypothetical protein